MKIKPSLHLVIYSLLVLFLLFSCKNSDQEDIDSNDIISVTYPETYELANIILSLTEYGKTDKYEVRKDFDYYHKVQDYFKSVNNHPLLDSVNYSRKKWENYLSFRTDSYAFKFDEKNELKRTYDFKANDGFQPFDDHLDLINDFVKKSNFRAFFKQNKSYYNSIIEKYKKTQYLNEMREFLTQEFGAKYVNDEKYNVVLSPFVYRMNCHRDIDSTTVADFITIPDYVLSDTVKTNPKDIATSLHNLFTEMDHGYVNPTTNKYKDLVTKNFDAKLWDNKSGYHKDKEFGVFNEYMTWAVYDIFLKKHFPDLADEIGLNWSFQNDSRGFIYAQLFTQKLLELYHEKEKNETINDLYPKLLDWTSTIQKELTKPKINIPKEVIKAKFSEKTPISITFSESMKKTDTITTIFQDGKNLRKFIDINATDHNLIWSDDDTKVQFNISLPKDLDTYYLQFNWWGTKHPLISQKGVLIKYGTYFKITEDK